MNKLLSDFLIRHATSHGYYGVAVLNGMQHRISVDWRGGHLVYDLPFKEYGALFNCLPKSIFDLAYEVSVHAVDGGDPAYSVIELVVGFVPYDDYAVREVLELELASASPRLDIEHLCRAALLGSDGARRKLAARSRALFDAEVDGREIRSA